MTQDSSISCQRFNSLYSTYSALCYSVSVLAPISSILPIPDFPSRSVQLPFCTTYLLFPEHAIHGTHSLPPTTSRHLHPARTLSANRLHSLSTQSLAHDPKKWYKSAQNWSACDKGALAITIAVNLQIAKERISLSLSSFFFSSFSRGKVGARGRGNLETHLDAPCLMMYVMVECILRRNPLEWIPGDGVTAVIIDSLQDG